MTVKEEKERLRKKYRNSGFTEEHYPFTDENTEIIRNGAQEDLRKKRAEISRRITDRLLLCPEWREAETVFCYVGTTNELDTMGILHSVLLEGKKLAVPKIEGKSTMSARRLLDLNELVPGVMGIPEPGDGTEIIPKEKPDLIIVPGLAFDTEGYRLGYGGGYYDKYLSGLSCHTIGLCPESRLLKLVPREPHDKRVSIILTEERTLRII